jgi:hypothetical protein
MVRATSAGARASVDFPALDAPLIRMILPGSRESFINVNSDESLTYKYTDQCMNLFHAVHDGRLL